MHQISTLYNSIENLIVNGFAEGKRTAVTVETGAGVSTVGYDLVGQRLPQFSPCTIETVIGDPPSNC